MENPIIVALDGMSREDSLELARKLAGKVWGFKVNSLLLECGTQIIRDLREFGQVMADPKLHDIPNTVENSIDAIMDAGPTFVTAHASGGVEMLRAAADTWNTVLAITVLTSHSEEEVHLIFGQPAKAKVVEFARWAWLADCKGIVCSPQELVVLSRLSELKGLIRVVPGIRPAGSDAGDQKRADTPRAAILAGADYLVIGRPITEKGDPVDNVRRIMDEIGPALEARTGRRNQ